MLIVNDDRFVSRAEVIREKGTNRSQFFRSAVDKYSWVDVGSSYLMNDISAAYLWGNIGMADEITQNRLRTWRQYYDSLKYLEIQGFIELPNNHIHNAHMFYIKVMSLNVRDALIGYLKEKYILAVFHYVPLHSSSFGKKFKHGDMEITNKIWKNIVRLPLYPDLKNFEIKKILKFLEISIKKN